MDKVYVDFETKSEVPIEFGIPNYLRHSSADIICLGFAVNNNEVGLWIPGKPLPRLPEKAWYYAHNAFFDYRVWNLIGAKRYGLPAISLTQWRDTMAIAARYNFPHSLGNLSEVEGTPVAKNPIGKKLIKKICCPPFIYSRDELLEFYQYCKDDVVALRNLVKWLPADRLADYEQKVWHLTQKINNRGIPVDTAAVNQIIKVTEAYQIEQAQLLPGLTNYEITKPTQAARIVKWVNAQGVEMANCQAATIETMLARDDISDNIRTVLEIRQECGLSSVAKYKKIQQQTHQGRVYDNLKYYGAGTGRWAGMGFQVHNLPRAGVKDQEQAIASFFDLSVLQENPIAKAKALVRAMIKARPGFQIMSIDYTSIENVLLAWTTQDWDTIYKFGKGFCQYSDMAAFLYNVPYEDILHGHKAGNKEMSAKRQFGKVIILGCGYGLGSNGFYEQASSYGIELTKGQAVTAVEAYRARYPSVPQLWYKSRDCAFSAIESPGTAFTYKRNTYRVVPDRRGNKWLQLTMPSGRALYYYKPALRPGKYGDEVTAMGVNPYSKKWQRLRIIPGRFAENIIQALARDILANGKVNCDAAGFRIIASIHDEIMFEEPVGNTRYDEAKETMCRLPEWAKTPVPLPLRADGFVADRFRKD